MRRPSQTHAQKAMTTRVAIELPRTQESGEILGFILGDGSIDSERGRIGFANTEPDCIKKILADLEKGLGVDREEFYYHVTAPFGSDPEIVSRTWQDNLGLKREVKVYEDRRKKTKSTYGVMSVWINNRIINRAIESGLARLLETNQAGKEEIIGFLKGFFAAEGAIIPGKVRKEVPNSIQFPQKGRRIPMRIKDFLDELSIDGRVVLKQRKADYYCVNITGFENFRKFGEYGLADMHPVKKEKLRRGFQAYKNRISRRGVTATKLLRLIAESKSITRQEIYSKLNCSTQQINGLLYSKKSYLVKNGLIQKTVEGDSIHWKITEKGMELLPTDGKNS